MKMVKNERQELILRIIRENDISTQEELTNLIRKQGLEVTQATCSRDIKELGIIKVILPNNQSKYAVLDKTGDIAPGRLLSVFSNSLLSCKNAMNIVVIRTLPGMAQAAASALDSMHLQYVVGTIAGDDTVFVATESVDEAKALSATILDMTGSEHADKA